MSSLRAVVAHGGGPTAVLNASLAGLVDECRSSGGFASLEGARFGVQGLLSGEYVDLLAQPPDLIESIAQAPGSAIGSSRRKLEGAEYERVVGELRRRDVHWLFHTGGNGSMSTALQLERFARAAGYELGVTGIPKTIDNDLRVTDHTPGYAPTARFFACAARDVGEDNRSLPSPICVLETLGRNAGWIVAATSLARRHDDDAPHLIYFPERGLSLDRIAADSERVVSRLGRVTIAVCEGQLDEAGQPFGADVDRPAIAQQRLASNLGHTLAQLLAAKTGLRARSERPGLLGRSCGPFANARDRATSYECGLAAARAALEGRSGCMVAIRRESSDPWITSTFLTPLEAVAGKERALPLEWIAPDANDVMPAFHEYARPLIGDVPGYSRLL
ncbi:MAG TPA: diphosphate--fructose-6-phosphate 1-phosphotransferase [Bryobacteraceae bacterium]|nr:diphosphate--fructose-6-phosphate 1-phosphotransferase [Bryobacteraceae bacterium]